MNKINIKNALTKEIVKIEFWIGLVTIILLLSIVGLFGFKEIKKYQATHQENQKIISPIPTSEISTTPTPTVKPRLAQIKKLADTNMTIIAQNNDTFWNISKRYCGNGRFFETIERLNGYSGVKLQPGDKIIVYCY